MSSRAVNYRCEERKFTPRSSLPLVDIYVDQGEDIPYKKDWSNRRCTMSGLFSPTMERMLKFKIRPDDVWVVTMPRCGTTWMQETAWLINNDFDFETATSIQLMERSIFVEMSGLWPLKSDLPSSFDAADNLKSPRLLKSHLPASFLPTEIWKKKSKVIYVARNVKDTIVSSYHFALHLGTFKGTKEEFIEDFLKDDLFYTPYWPHTMEFFHMRNEPNIFFTSYERMKKDLKGVIKDLCIFLEKPIPNEEILDKAVDHLSFDSMIKSPAGQAHQKMIDEMNKGINNESDFQFLRRGIVGSYKDELPEELVKKIDQWSTKFLKETNTTNEQLFGL